MRVFYLNLNYKNSVDRTYVFSSYDKALNFYCNKQLNNIKIAANSFVYDDFIIAVNIGDLIFPIPLIDYKDVHDNIIKADKIQLINECKYEISKGGSKILIKIPIEIIQYINLKPNKYYSIFQNYGMQLFALIPYQHPDNKYPYTFDAYGSDYIFPYKYNSKSDLIEAWNILNIIKEKKLSRELIIEDNTININNCHLFIKFFNIKEYVIDLGDNKVSNESEDELKTN